MEVLTLSGSSPLTMTFSDGSVGTYELTDPTLLAAITHGSSALPPLPGSEDPVFCTLEWPADLRATLGSVELSLNEVTIRFINFLRLAIQESLARLQEAADNG